MGDPTEDEAVQHGSFVNQQMRSYCAGFSLRQQGLIDEEQWRTFATSVAFLVRYKAFSEWWAERGQASFPAAFGEFIESHLDE